MKFIEQRIKGVFEVRLNPLHDSRGFFMRTFDVKLFDEIGYTYEWVQENHSLSIERNVLRGLHFQFSPFAETKLVRVIRGSVLDVYVDLRRNSETFGEWGSIVLTSVFKNMAFIPRGFAHGYLTLEDYTEVIYKVDNFYYPESESGIIWNDKELSINWGIDNPILSDKDTKLLSFNEFVINSEAIKL
ncbi:MAG: dTDP-4-dehydrorhamnose 3,5-epimerase [Mariniphaga sp.]